MRENTASGTISNWFYLSKSDVSLRMQESIKRELTTKSWFAEDGEEPVRSYTEDREGYLGIPIVWGMERFDYLDQTSMGSPITVDRLPDPEHPKAAKGQRVFIKNLYEGITEHSVILAEASTGSGKTVACLSLIGQLGVTSLVIVPSESLALQWIDEAKLHLGIADEDIALIKQGKCDYVGKKICVGIVHSIAKRDYDPEFYTYFGLVAWDEVHRVAAKSFSKSMGKLSPRYRIGLTATPDRRDGLMEVVTHHLGEPLVVSKAKAVRAKVCVFNSSVFAVGANNQSGDFVDRSKSMPRSIVLNMLCKSKARNAQIVALIRYANSRGRTILVISDRIERLQVLMGRCAADGIPSAAMGMFTRSVMIENPRASEAGQKKLKSKTVKQSELDYVKNECSIIFATYGMMKEGVDIPRLDFGIDASPRSEAIQVIGRIRRPVPNKKAPVWVTIKDTSCAVFDSSYRQRISDYKKCNCDIVKMPLEIVKAFMPTH